MKSKMPTNDLIRDLGRMPAPTIDPDASQRIRTRMLAEFRAVTNSPHNRYMRTETYVLRLFLTKHPMVPIILAFVLLMGTTGTAFAANNSLPGDPLYGLDRTLEQAQLSFAFGDLAKADRLVSIAQEREEEMVQLREQNRLDDIAIGEKHEQRALRNAEEVMVRVRAEHQNTDNGKSGEALDDVEQKLAELQNRYEERVRQRAQVKLENKYGTLELEAEIEGDQTKIQLHVGEQQMHYTLDSTDAQSIYNSIEEKTGVSAGDVQSVLTIKQPDSGSSDESSDDADGSPSANANTNREQDQDQNRNTNQAMNQNTNQDRDTNQTMNQNTAREQDQDQNRNTNQDRDTNQTMNQNAEGQDTADDSGDDS